MLKFGPWAPDLPALENPGALIAKNLIPLQDSYGPLSDIEPFTNALTARCQGAFAARDSSGNVNIFAGDATELYRLSTGSTWENVSQATTTYATSSVNKWDFCNFGDRVIATNYSDLVQNYIIGTSTDFDDLYADFKAKYCAVVRDFVVYAYTNESGDGEQPQRVWWTGINDPTTVAPSPTTQSDFQDLLGEGGEITGIVTGLAGADAIIIQRNALWKMNYTGDQLIFRFDKIEGAKGCFVPGSISQFGGMFFYLAEDGWYQCDGLSSIPIGAGRINKWFFADFMATKSHLVSSMVDPINQVMICSYPDNDSDAVSNKLIIYNFLWQKFSYGELASEFIFPAYTLASSIDDFGSTSIDAIPFSLDSAVYAGGVLRLSAFDATHMLNYMTGDALEATIDTGEAQVTPGKRSFVTEIWPYIDGGSVSIYIGTRNLPTESVTWAGPYSVNSLGYAPLRSDARYHRVRAVVAAGGAWTHAQGINPKIAGSSWR